MRSCLLEQRGDRPGLVHVLSAMEACPSYRFWHDKTSHKTFPRPGTGKCPHYYFYFMDAELGLVYLRVPTWAPFRLQFYCNAHNWLARQLTAEGIGYTTADNAGACPREGGSTSSIQPTKPCCTFCKTLG